MSSIPQIPTDIIHTILYQITIFDPPVATQTLSACSLASSALLAPAQKLLFHTIELSINLRLQSTRFESLLINNPTLGTYVRKLTIHERVRGGHFRLLQNGLRMARVLRALVGLEVIRVRTYEGIMQWPGFSDSLKTAFLELFKSGHLETLWLENMEGVPLDAFLGSKGVRKIVLNNVRIRDLEDREGKWEYTTKPTAIEFSRSFAAAQGLLRASRNKEGISLEGLRFMKWAPWSKAEAVAIRPLIAGYGKYEFDEMEYNLAACTEAVYMPEDGVPLDTLPHLRTLSSRVPATFFRDTRHLRNLAQYLTTASPSNALNTLRIIVDHLPFNSKSQKQQLVDADWRSLDTVIVNRAQFGYLRTVEVRVNLRANPGWRKSAAKGAEEEWEGRLEEVLKEKLKMVEASGVDVRVKVAVPGP